MRPTTTFLVSRLDVAVARRVFNVLPIPARLQTLGGRASRRLWQYLGSSRLRRARSATHTRRNNDRRGRDSRRGGPSRVGEEQARDENSQGGGARSARAL